MAPAWRQPPSAQDPGEQAANLPPSTTSVRDQPLLRALREPLSVARWSGAECSRLLQQARASSLLGRVAVRVEAACAEAGVLAPAALAPHFAASHRLCRAQQAEVEREARYLRAALATVPGPIVMLKGAAYVLAGLPAATGRLFSDIDLMVPKARLAQAESQLLLHGWMGTPQTPYDERYYRQWMHELPPMAHVHRGTTIDLHHTILPETARLRPDAAALFATAQPLAGWPGMSTLGPAEMVLHGATHLYLNDETGHALRDLCDLDALLRHFGHDAAFWTTLFERAEHHQLQRPLYYALRHVQALLGLQLPAPQVARWRALAPPAPVRALMDRLWLAAFDPARRHAVAQLALYVRGHWLRMPAPLLVRHLGIKALGLHEREARRLAGTAAGGVAAGTQGRGDGDAPLLG